MLIASVSLQAQTSHTVANTNDDGLGSLRELVGSVIFNAGDTIRFDPNIIATGSDTIILTTGEIDFGNKGVIIKGLYNATDTMYISGNNNSRIFSFVGAGRVVLDSLVLINGTGAGATNSGNGGAIQSYESIDTLFVKNSIISDNTASNGGGIYSYSIPFSLSLSSSSISLNNSTVSGNTASGSGGGIFSEASRTSSVIVINSSMSANTASSGGGIFSGTDSFSDSSYVSILNSTISGNTADEGGGIFSMGNHNISSIKIDNSTIANNIATSGGGAIHSYGIASWASSSINVIYSTISGNTASSGGAIYSNCQTSSVNIKNSTLSENTTPTFGEIYYSNVSVTTITSSIIAGSGANFSSMSPVIITSNGYNIFSDTPSNIAGTDQTGVTAAQLNLQALAFNGGATQTMLPGAGSVAINMGAPSDMSDAQNRTVSGGIRDAGAAETACNTVAGVHTETICFGESITVGSTVYDANKLTGSEVLISANNCDSTVTVTLTIESAIDVTTATTNQTITANQTGATYNWIDCSNGNTVIAGATSANYTATTNGDYAVEITVGNCVDTSACVTVNTVGINENNFGDQIKLYPNPTKSNVVIDLGEVKAATVLFTDLTGKEVLLVKNINSNTITLNTSSLNKGLYFVTIQSNNNQKILKLVKQ